MRACRASAFDGKRCKLVRIFIEMLNTERSLALLAKRRKRTGKRTNAMERSEKKKNIFKPKIQSEDHKAAS